MRITYRFKNNKDYWDKRWGDIPADAPMTNTNAYPLKYALGTVDSKDGKILEAGCGAGRILRCYHDLGYDITGFDFIEVAVEKLKKVDSSLKVEVGDITKLKYENDQFRYLLAFGLFHNLENGLDDAINESYRVLEKGGRICASFRADNIQTRLTDWLANKRNKKVTSAEPLEFHKLNLTRKEFTFLFEKAGFVISKVFPVENMPILYKFSFFRARSHKKFNENIARSEGYKLSFPGKILQRILMKFLPNQFCNIYVLIATKP
jgi:SAM-dependent methyltransferase